MSDVAVPVGGWGGASGGAELIFFPLSSWAGYEMLALTCDRELVHVPLRHIVVRDQAFGLDAEEGGGRARALPSSSSNVQEEVQALFAKAELQLFR